MTATQTVRVLVDLTRLLPGGEVGGIKPALVELLRGLGRQEPGRIQFVLVSIPATHAEVAALARPEDSVIDRTQLGVDGATRLRCDVVYCPFGVTDLACPGVPTVTLVVDLLHRDFPETLAEHDRAVRERDFQSALAVTDRFQVISDYTAGRLQECYAVPADRIFRTHLPVHGRLTEAAQSGIASAPFNRPYFFYPANAWPHKNHETLLVAYALYRQAAGPAAWPLVLTGHADARVDRLKQVARSLQIEAEVCFAGYVSEEQLTACYRQAGALVFPSLHEGFGIPLLEAMALGTPILASDATAIPEITGPAALRVDARQPALLAAALERMAGDPGLRRRLVAHGRNQLATFSPAAELKQLREAIGRAAQNPARWRRTGYHAVDGLTDPLAIFALPLTAGEITLALTLRPLPAARTLQIACGGEMIAELIVPAGQPGNLTVAFAPRARAIVLRVPDAGSLSPTDPRTHGVLLESLQVRTDDGRWHDLRGAETT